MFWNSKAASQECNCLCWKERHFEQFLSCDIKLYGMLHKSAEHAYQYKKAIQTENDKVAERILEAKTAFQAKVEASFLPYNPNWTDKKEKGMQEVLSAKAKCYSDFCKLLIESEGVIAEAVPGDLFWSTGLTKEQCYVLKKMCGLGKTRWARFWLH